METTSPPAQGLPANVRSVVEGARTGDAVFVAGPDGRIVYWDGRAAFLTGIPAGEALGRSCAGVISGSSCPVECPGLRTVGEEPSGAPAVGGWLDLSVLSFAGAGDEETHHVHLLRDGRERREALDLARAIVRLAGERGTGGRGAAPRARQEPRLTPRQTEVLARLAEGRSAKEISRELQLAEATVRNHIRALLQALDAHSQLEALARAREAGLLLPPGTRIRAPISQS